MRARRPIAGGDECGGDDDDERVTIKVTHSDLFFGPTVHLEVKCVYEMRNSMYLCMA